MLEIILLIAGFIIVIKSSDVLVDAASSLAIKCHIPKMLIALTIVSFGTCAPEIAISFNSVAENNGTMAFANVIGSCIVNIFLIIGLASITKPIKVKHETIKKELPILLLITTSFCVLMLDALFTPGTKNTFSRADGLILIILFLIFVVNLVQLLRKKEDSTKEEQKIKYKNPIIAILLLILSIIFISYSSELIVNNAIKLAKMLDISEKMITMTAIVIGTSLPEMFMTISSAKKNEFDMTIGNIIGTNIFNICIVLGLPVVIYGNVPLENFTIIDILVVFVSSLNLYLYAKSERTISRIEGIIMILIFIAYYTYLLLGN